jgi:hypothetical protein
MPVEAAPTVPPPAAVQDARSIAPVPAPPTPVTAVPTAPPPAAFQDARDIPPVPTSPAAPPAPSRAATRTETVRHTKTLRELVERIVTGEAPGATATPSSAPVPRPALAAPPRPATPREPPQRGGDATPEVAAADGTPTTTIHIGRVELTAIAPPPPARRPPAAAVRAPMSLDEYLRRRDAKSR